MQDLAGIRAVAGRRVVAELASVPVASALLGVPVDLGDEAVDVDRQPRLARPGARPPRTGQRLTAPSTRASIPSRRPSATASTIPAFDDHALVIEEDVPSDRPSSRRDTPRSSSHPHTIKIEKPTITISARPGPAQL